MNNVILIGFMGCGKTTIGRKLSYRLMKTFLDTDNEIEKRQGKKVAEIFAEHGEPYFRQLETEYLHYLIEKDDSQVIATGGGLSVQRKNKNLLKQLGIVVFLRVTEDTIFSRLEKDTTRPLLQGDNPREKVRELMAVRIPLYEKIADVIIDTDGRSFSDILNEIEAFVEAKKKKNKSKKNRKRQPIEDTGNEWPQS